MKIGGRLDEKKGAGERGRGIREKKSGVATTIHYINV